jgi:ADP-heptose:LPS heptosyltransferase
MSNVLIIRFSAIGDVAMTIPVIYSVSKANPNDSFTVVTQSFLISLFINKPDNLKVIGVDTGSTERSFFGFLKYIISLNKEKYDIVVDLHNVIRSRIADTYFRLNGKRVCILDKNRKERKRLLNPKRKEIFRLTPVIKRYGETFQKAGFNFDLNFVSLFEDKPVDENVIVKIAGEKSGNWIGIAPFAKHKGKIYPLDKMEKVVERLSVDENNTVFLVGGRGEEEKILEEWSHRYKNTRNLSGKYTFDIELSIMSKFDVLISMDSANMHFASLVDTKVISVWGATHPCAGFYGYRQKESFEIQLDLDCRPCSIFGNKPCYRGDWYCMTGINPEVVIEKVKGLLFGI